MITYSTELAAASQYNISSKTLIVDLPFINSVPSHISNLGIGGLKTFPNSCYLANDDADIAEVRQGQGTILLNPLKNQTGSITYLQSTNKYYMWSSSAWQQLAALTTGIPNFSSGLTASGIYVTSPGNIFLNGGNIATTGTASFGGITSSVLNQYYVPVANNTRGLVNSAIYDNGSSPITLGRATYVNGNFQANGTISAVTGFTSSTGYIQIGGGATSSTGFYSPGTSNLTTLNVSTISSSGLATLADLYVPGNTQLGNEATDTTSVFGTLSIVNAGSTSGSITCDSNGNLIFDGSGAGGVEITDGLMYLGSIPIQSGSYSGPSYTGGMISSSAKIVAVNGFANAGSDIASFEVDASGNLQCASLKETSLRQYKHEIHYITESQLLNISKLKPITFLYNQDVPQDVNDTRIRQAGFIAQQVEQIYPQVAWYKQGKLAGLQYQRLTAYLTRGIQELAQENDKLNIRVTQLENTVAQLLKGMNT